MRLPISSFLGLCLCLGLLGGEPAHALDPERSIDQYKHTSWTIDDGVPRSILALAQGPSGYLWIGSSVGLYRFDGINFEKISAPQRDSESRPVSALRVSQQGDVWVGYATGGTAVFRDGKLREVPMADPAYVMDFVQTPDQAIWAMLGRRVHQLIRFANGRWNEVGTQLGFPSENVIAMMVARDGTIWVTTNKSVLLLRNGAARFRRIDVPLSGHGALSEDGLGNVWLSDELGTRVIAGGGGTTLTPARPIRYATPFAERRALTTFDRDGNLWGVTEQGLFRLRFPQLLAAAPPAPARLAVARFGKGEGLTSDVATALLEDREGNIWVGTMLGLDRFRTAKVVTEPLLTKRALWGDVLLGASDGTVYVGEADAIYRIRPHRAPELFMRAHEPQAMCEGTDASVWIVLQDRIVRVAGDKIDSFPGPGKADQGISDCALDRKNHIWLAALRDGMFERLNGAWRQTMVPPPMGGFPPSTLFRDRRQRLLVGFDENTVALIDPPAAPKFLVPPSRGLEVRTLFEGPQRLVIGGQFGLAEVDNNRIRLISSSRLPELLSVSGIVQIEGGQTWISSAAGLVGISTAAFDKAFADPNYPLTSTILDFRDGLPGVQGRDAVRSLAKGGDGRIWFANGAGTVWIDPAHFRPNDIPPPVAIAGLTSQGVVHRDPRHVTLPAGSSSIEIVFAALSLSIPERVKVLYRLEGADSDWVDPGIRRQAFYTNLGPGHYVFRMIAANDEGVWNRTGTTLEFDIAPTFRQSNWFVALCGLAILLALWAAYSVRLRQVAGRMRVRLEERLAERERIARDLHDTLLQGFQGLILRFQSVANQIPADQPVRSLMDETLDTADGVLNEGRDSVHRLRAADANELSQTFAATAERLRDDYPAEFNMVVEGTPRALHPVIREELGRIGQEALINAFQHAKAGTIELVLSYHPSALSLGIRDDGIGIDPGTFAGGRQGHFGLVGMRERAGQIGATLNITSRPHSGTEIVVTVAGRAAYSEKSRVVARLVKLFSGRD